MKVALDLTTEQVDLLVRAINMAQDRAMRENREYLKVVSRDLDSISGHGLKVENSESAIMEWVDEGNEEVKQLQRVKKQVLDLLEGGDV